MRRGFFIFIFLVISASDDCTFVSGLLSAWDVSTNFLSFESLVTIFWNLIFKVLPFFVEGSSPQPSTKVLFEKLKFLFEIIELLSKADPWMLGSCWTSIEWVMVFSLSDSTPKNCFWKYSC